jgi:hypothetical protein
VLCLTKEMEKFKDMLAEYIFYLIIKVLAHNTVRIAIFLRVDTS